MATYTATDIIIESSLDNLGLKLGLQRLPEETLGDYRRRLYLEQRDPSGPSQRDYIRTVGRKVGLFDEELFRLTPPQAASTPRVIVSSTRFQLFEDDVDVPVLDVSLDELKFVKYLVEEIGTTGWTIENYSTDSDYLKCRSLRFDSTFRETSGFLLRGSTLNPLPNDHLFSYSFSDRLTFLTPQASPDDLLVDGDYYVDKLNGLVYTRTPARGYMQYFYDEFPFSIWYSPVRAFPMNDPDLAERYYDVMQDTDSLNENLEVRQFLTSIGAEQYGAVQNLHGLFWDK